MATFTWVPFHQPKVQDRHNVLTTEFESGKVQKRYKGSKGSIWTLKFKTTWAEMAAIRAFYNARKGSFESFTWVDPWSSTTKTVRFSDDNAEWETEFKVNGIFEVKFEEVL